MKIALCVLISFGLLFSFGAYADETEEITIQDTEEITAQDLEISEPTTLPGNFFYGFKNAWRNIRLAFTADSVKKAELRLEFSNELMLEARKLAEQNKEALLQKTMERYEKHMQKISERAEKLKEDPEAGKFLDKLTDKMIKHQVIMERLENNLEDKPEVLAKIRANRERALESFGTIMSKVEENTEKTRERMENQMQEIIREKAPDLQQQLEQNKEKIRERVEQVIKRTTGECENKCGDNECQEVVCEASDCPCFETPIICPQDCETEANKVQKGR
ncbi:hypothetical protein KJ684_01645 [Patescibacteria group bacterium]|nr:hypothetical protein [Patescibacteria group bacterium]